MAAVAIEPRNNGTLTIVVTSSSVATKFRDGGGVKTPYVFYNSATTDAFVAWGDSSASTTATSGYPVGAGQKEVIWINGTHLAVIGTSGNLYVTPVVNEGL